MKAFGIVGCGKMGQAISARAAAGLDCPVICCDVLDSAREAIKGLLMPLKKDVTVTGDIGEIAARCDVVLLAVKPVHAPEVLKVLAGGCDRTILSIVAGIKHAKLVELSGGRCCVRAMPNTPALVGAGSTVVLDNGLAPEIRALAEKIFSASGHCHFVTSESMMDAVTGLSGSGPALFAMLVDALADAGVAEGLTRGVALALARETMAGTAALLKAQHPAILRENVMSPGGTTAAGVLAAGRAGFGPAAQAFVTAAAEKSRQLG